ncbi:MAG: lamin tail domain-containing protein [Anaerolineae bacterium]
MILLMVAGLLPRVPAWSSALDQNLLTNPGFEAGPVGWNVQPSTATFTVVSVPTHQGEGAASLAKTESRGWAFIFQDVPVTAGERYSAQVWAIWNDEQLANVKLRVEWLDGSGDRLALDDVSAETRSPTYQLLPLENLEAPAEAVVARVQGYTYVREANPEQPALFDDFVFATVSALATTPEPSPTATTTPTVVLPVPTVTPTATPIRVPPGAVVINEVFYDPPDPGGDPDDEWVELYNTTEYAVNLDGWVLADHIGEDALPAVELLAGSFVVVAASDSFRSLYPAYEGLLITLDGPIGNGLANSGDSLWLRDDQGRIIDAVAYGDDTGAMFPSVPTCPEGYSLERVPAGRDTDTAGDWFPRSVPSPGRGINIQRLYLPIVVR